VAEELSKEPRGSLPPHPLESLILPPSVWPEENIASTCIYFVKMLEVYEDDFCTMVQTTAVNKLRHISRALLHGIHSVFLPPSISGHDGGDPMLHKKLLEGEGTWDVRKEILRWVFDGARRCIEFPGKSWKP